MTRICSLLLILTFVAACSDSNDTFSPAEPPLRLPIGLAVVESAPPGDYFLQQNTFDLADVGYEAEEYFVSGRASSFTNVSELTTDGNWQVEPAEEADYKTRIVVHRPVDSSKFSGTAMVEWLNVTAGFDLPNVWAAGHVEIYRGGHIWIGVSAQIEGVEGSGEGFGLSLKTVDPERYGDLNHPGDSFSFDMFSQISRVLREPGDVDPLSGMQPDQLLAMGQSQSASRMVTFVNALHPIYLPYDGYLVHSRGDEASPMSQEPQPEIGVPDGTRIREDIATPVMTVQAETDVLDLGYVIARQDDTEHFRLWEVAGGAHSDYYTIVSGRADSVGEPRFAAVVEQNSLPGFVSCDLPFNAGPMHYAIDRALHDLDLWMKGLAAPSQAPRLDMTEDQAAFLLDDNGNVTGGIRTPYVEAPTAVLSGGGNSDNGFCRLFGTTSLYSADQLASLYVDRDTYVEAVTESANAAVEAGFLLPESAEAIITWAPSQWDSQVEGN